MFSFCPETDHVNYYYFCLFYFISPTGTKPVGLKINYNMVSRLGSSALGKKLRLGESVAEGVCIAYLKCYRHPLVQICYLERLVGNRSDPSFKIFDEFRRLWAPGAAYFDGDRDEGMRGG